MPKYSVQICFATGQSDSNLLPILASDSKLEKVLVLATPTMSTSAEFFKEALKHRVSVEVLHLQNDLKIKEINDLLIDKLPEYEGKVVFNITGGTKLMTVAAFVICSSLEIPFCYLELKTFKLYFFEKFPLNINEEPRIQTIGSEIAGSLNYLKTFLGTRGYIAKELEEWGSPSEDQKRYFDFIMGRSTDEKKKLLMEGIKPLNKAASLVTDDNVSKDSIELSEALNLYLDELQDLGWVRYVRSFGNRGKLQFKNREIARFLAGIWFEQYCAEVIKSLNLGVTLIHGKVLKEGIENECDVLFLLNGKLFLIEIKTANLTFEPKAQDIVYKLDSLRESLGGKSSKACLLSLEKVDHRVLDRAHQLGITCIDGVAGTENELKRQLREWIKS